MQRRFHLRLLSFLFLSVLSTDGLGQAGQEPDFPPDTPYRLAALACQRDRPDAILRALPPSYRADLQHMMHTFGNNIDPEVFNAATNLLHETHRLLIEKEDLLIDSGILPFHIDKDALVAIQKTLGTLCTSRLMSQNHWKTGDLTSTLQLDISGILASSRAIPIQAIPQTSLLASIRSASQLKAQTRSVDGNQAIVRVTFPNGQHEDFPTQRIEGRWIPKALAQNWPSFKKQTTLALKSLRPPQADQAKPFILALLGTLTNIIQDARKASTANDMASALAMIKPWL